mmetsp:Transcript_57946/g.168022  ORF Transcript_57946/g.168022 Transcript_57946/m.168022 type:complete len:226 (-) Transcript_57946:571-1248(-)
MSNFLIASVGKGVGRRQLTVVDFNLAVGSILQGKATSLLQFIAPGGFPTGVDLGGRELVFEIDGHGQGVVIVPITAKGAKNIDNGTQVMEIVNKLVLEASLQLLKSTAKSTKPSSLLDFLNSLGFLLLFFISQTSFLVGIRIETGRGHGKIIIVLVMDGVVTSLNASDRPGTIALGRDQGIVGIIVGLKGGTDIAIVLGSGSKEKVAQKKDDRENKGLHGVESFR